MSTEKRKNETVYKNVKKQKTELITCQHESIETIEIETIERENLSLKSLIKDCKKMISKGEHENQISEGGEADLHKHKNECKKNPGHPEFIPIESFSLKHLPEGHQDSGLYEFIKSAADVTVKLSVTMTSPDRPEFWPDTKIPYFLSDLRGKRTLRTGSGIVRGVWMYTDEIKHWKYESCPCDKCKASDKPSKVWWEIYVNTAAHVIVDDVEASHTALRFFYDRKDSEVVILKDKVPCLEYVNIEEDRCLLSCVTCNENLGENLKKVGKIFSDNWNKVLLDRHIDKLNFIVSHPHGCSKQVSVGRWNDKVQVGDDKLYNNFTYTTCTCPGSSGANVFCVGDNGGWYGDNFHSGSLKSGLNYSGAGWTG